MTLKEAETICARLEETVDTCVENDFETSSGVDEIELDIGDCYLGIEISDIVKVEPVDKIL